MRLPLIFFLLFLLMAACAPQPASPTPQALELVFMPGYKPQASLPFVGGYVALEKGFFTAQSLKVTLQASPGQGQHLQLTAAGKVHVTTQDAAVMLQRRADPGLPLVAFALLGQKGQQAFAVLESSPIRSPKDWEGRTVGYKGTPPPDLFALMDAAGVDKSRVKLVNVGFDPRLLAEGKVDVYPVFKSNEPYLLRSWGYPVRLWEAADYGVPALGLVYVTSEETLRTQPEALTRFLRAALEGMRYAAANRDEAVQIVMKYAGPETDPLHMRFMLDAELADAESEVTRQFGLGWQTLEQWQTLAGMLQQHGALKAVDASQAFTTSILQAAK
jgi:ABC-type nitrate/sulfonate/bicarbonate transport system substrate-binding protein